MDTNASLQVPPPDFGWAAPGVTGSGTVRPAMPVMKTLPWVSAVIWAADYQLTPGTPASRNALRAVVLSGKVARPARGTQRNGQAARAIGMRKPSCTVTR